MRKLLCFCLSALSFFTCIYPAAAQEKIISLHSIPVLAWEWQAPPEENTPARYKEMNASGITYSFIYFTDVEAMIKGLDIAAQTGLKMVVYCPELKTDTKRTVSRIMHHPALAGYFLGDEPNSAAFPELGKWVRQIRAVDDHHFCYINLFPNYANEAQLGAKTYREYVQRFIQEVPVKILSFDHYPVVGDSLRENWYENLEIFSDEARKAGKPFWAFALTVAHGPYPVPTVAQLRLQVYSDLAYGAQGIQYFRYWTPVDTVWHFRHGPITQDAQRSEVYDRIKLVNTEIKQLSGIFLGAKVISVAHTGNTIPQGTTRLTTLPEPVKELKTKGTGALVSVLKKDTDTFLVVVNRDFDHSMELTINCDAKVKKVVKDGSLVPASAYISTMEIDPGDAAIYTWTGK